VNIFKCILFQQDFPQTIIDPSSFIKTFLFFKILRHLATYDAAWQPLPVNLLRYTLFIWLFGAYLVCCVYIFYIFSAIFL